MYLLITILLILAVAHLTYESVVLPTIRLSTRYKLFALRDRLRLLKHLRRNEISNEVFEIVDSTINNTLTLLPHFTMSILISSAKRLSEKPEIVKKSQSRMELVNNCEIDEIKKIAEKAGRYLFQTLIYYSLALFIILSPIIIVIVMIRSLFREIKNTTKNIAFTKGNIDLEMDFNSPDLVSG